MVAESSHPVLHSDAMDVEPSPEEMWGINGIANQPEDMSYHAPLRHQICQRYSTDAAPPVVGLGAWAEYMLYIVVYAYFIPW